MSTDIITASHNATVRLPFNELVADLNINLGTTLVAYIANVASRQLPARWASARDEPRHVDPRDDVKRRLTLAHTVFHAIYDQESEHVARQWLIGANPRFDGHTPAERIREGDFAGVHGALRAFLDDTGGA